MKKLMPVIILAVLFGLAFLVLRNPPQADRIEAPAGPQLAVDGMKLDRRPYRVTLQSYGTVQALAQEQARDDHAMAPGKSTGSSTGWM